MPEKSAAGGGCTQFIGWPARYLLISNIIRAGGCRLLHGNQTEHLQQVVLHHITGDRKERNTFIYKSCLIRISKSSQPLKGILMHKVQSIFTHFFFISLWNYAFLFALSSTFMVLHTMHFHCMEHFVQALKILCSTEENHTGWMKQTFSFW